MHKPRIIRFNEYGTHYTQRKAGAIVTPINPTLTSIWHSFVKEAADRSGIRLNADIETYLIFTLIHFTTKTELAKSILAIEYLQAIKHGGNLRQAYLRDVADKCLIFSGLFPERAQRKHVKISYFVGLGISAYQQLSDRPNEALAVVYDNLANSFVSIMDILLSARSDPYLDPFANYELWQDTGSAAALRIITPHLKDASDFLAPENTSRN